MSRAAAAILVGLSLVGCTQPPLATGTPMERDRATLVVDNRSTLEMTIYALRGSQRVRLGQASAIGQTAMTIPPDFVGGSPFRFIADPIGSTRAPVTQELTVMPGDTVEMQIPPR
jgi:hypothetical protein